MVTIAERFGQRRSLQEIIGARVQARAEKQSQAAIATERQRIQREGERLATEALKEVEEKARAREEFERGPQFRVVSISVERRGKVKSTVFTAKTREEAEQLSKRASKALGRDTSISIERIKFGEAANISKVVGPVPSERGRQLQRARQELEKITKKVQVIDQKVDVSLLSSRERARVRQLTGVKAEEAFTAAPTKPETSLERVKRLESKKRTLRLAPKLKFETPAEARAAGFDVITPKALKVEKDLLGRDGFESRVGREDIGIPISSIPSSRLVEFEKEIQAQKAREQRFITSKGFERIETVAGVLTGGFQKRGEVRAVVPIEERGIIGRVGQSFIRSLLAFPIATGGAISEAAEKIKLTGKALTIPEIEKRKIREELFVGAPKRIVTEFKELPIEEKIATGIFVATAPFIGGGALRRFTTRQVTRAKAIQELTLTEKAKLERFELSVKELKGVRTQPERINLQEVQRLTPKAATALEKVILRRKDDIVVGGSVAQRSQIIGKSRIPEDIDIFTSRKPKELVEEIATELKQAGVERVSTVKGKQITIKGKKAIEVKELGLLKQNIQRVQLPLQFVSSAFVKTPRGVRVLRLGAQAQRKVIGGFGLELERRRVKDIEDLPPILRTLRQLRTEKRASVLSGRRRGVSPPSILPISLLTGLPSLIAGRRGEPSGLGGILPSRPSILRAIPKEEPSVVRPTPTEPPSIITLETPSIITPPTKEPPSIITLETPSIITPPTKEPPSIITPIPPEIPTIVRPPRKPPSKRLPKEEPIRIPKAPSLDVQIRRGEKRGDKFVTVEKSLPTNRAIRRLTEILDNFIEASGRLKPSKKKPRISDDILAPVLSKFRGPKKGSKLPVGTIIERRKFRLDTIGEIRQISFFKAQAEKKKQLKKAIQQKRTSQLIGQIGIARQKRITTQNFFTTVKSKTTSSNFFSTSRKKQAGFL